MADIQFLIKVDEQGAIKSVQNFDKAIDDLGKTSGTTGKSVGDLVKGVAIGEIVFKAAEKAMGFLWNQLKQMPQAAIEAEKANRALDAALDITGRKVPGLAQHFKDYADALMGVTIYDDEAIKGAQTLLVQLTNLDKNGIDKATKGAIGLASVFGMDLESAAQLVAKSMSGNTAMLSRYGIKVDETATKEQQRAEILDKLEQFYGRATAETETYGGKLAQLKNKYGEILEAAGKYIISNTNILTSLSKLADETIFYLTLKDRLISQQANQEQADKKIWKSIWDATYAIGFQSQAILDLSKKYDGNAIAVLHAINTDKQYELIKLKMSDTSKQAFINFQKEEKAINDLTKGTNKFGDEVKKTVKPLVTYADLLRDMPNFQKSVSKAQYEAIPILGKYAEGVTKVGMAYDLTKQKAISSFQVALEKGIETATKLLDAFSTAYYFIDATAQQTFRNKEILMENEYKKQVELIKSSTMNETQKADAMAQLDADYDKKRQELEKKKAEQQKQAAYTQAIISAFQAAAQTYASFGFPWGIIPAAIVLALGMGLAAKIKAQPIPLAKGAIFNQPQILSSKTGQDYKVAEGGEAEILSSPSKLREAIFGKGGKGTKVGGGSTIIHNYIYLDGKMMKEFIVKAVEESSQIGRLRVASKAVN